MYVCRKYLLQWVFSHRESQKPPFFATMVCSHSTFGLYYEFWVIDWLTHQAYKSSSWHPASVDTEDGATLPENPANMGLSGHNDMCINGSAPTAGVGRYAGVMGPVERAPVARAHGSGHTGVSPIRVAAGAAVDRSYTPWSIDVGCVQKKGEKPCCTW
jgi:hypothetical protein